MSHNRTGSVSWFPESTAETSAITDTTYYYGIEQQPLDLGSVQMEWIQQYRNGYEAGLTHLGKTTAKNSRAFFPVNGVMYYLIMGDSVVKSGSSPDSIRTVSAATSSTLPTITDRSEDNGGTATTRDEIVGNEVRNVSMLVDHTVPGLRAQMAVNLAGIDFNTPATSTSITPSFINSESSPYTGNADTVFEWDSDLGDSATYPNASNDDLMTYLQSISLSTGRVPLDKDVINQAETEKLFNGGLFHTFTFRVPRGPTAVLWTDYKAKTLHNFRYKIFNTATQYIEYNMTDAYIKDIKRPWDPRGGNVTPYYQVEGGVRSASFEILDGIADSIYGD